MKRERGAEQLAQKRLRHDPQSPNRRPRAEKAKHKEQVHAVKTKQPHRENRKHVKRNHAKILNRIVHREHMPRRPRL